MYGTIEQPQRQEPKAASFRAYTDEQLLLCYRNRREPGAFEELVRRYERELYGYLRHYLGDPQMAEDAFQQTFLQVHLKCATFEQGRRVRPWLYAVATNQAIDCQRRARRHRLVSLDDRLAKDRQDGAQPWDKRSEAAANPAEQTELVETKAVVRQALDALSPRTKAVVTLIYFQGMKYHEAAEVLGIPLGTVKSRLQAALEKLHKAIPHPVAST
jgi:RNA polymerase sigma-70 factor (ECF subfamily)